MTVDDAGGGRLDGRGMTVGQEDSWPVLAGGGELGERMRSIDWSKTPLGPVEAWPQSLKTCVRIILTSRQPMFVWWGDELINLYNDAYRSIVGGKHPEALGQPARVVWREIWDQVGPRAETAMRAQEGTYDEALLLIMERHGYEEETYYTFSYSPVPNDKGGTGGILCANTADTERIVGERQLALLRELAARTAVARSWQDACRVSTEALATNAKDVPFALLYVMDEGQLRLTGTAGIVAGGEASPLVVDGHGAPTWPLAEVVRTTELRLVDGLAERFVELPTGAWPRPPRQAALVPILSSGESGRPGVLVVGLNPFRLFDERYRRFLELVAGQIAAGIASAQAYEDERERAEALAEIDRAKTAFFGNVSHELRTPLTLMLGPVEDLLRGAHGELPEAQRSRLELVHRNALRLHKLVNTLLEFSRLEAGRARAAYQPVDLAALTRDVASAFQSAVEQAGLRFEVDCPPLPGPIFVDPGMWEKIVLNLVSNAFKFTLEGSIAVSLRAEAEGAVLRVQDTGVGVPEAEVPRLFERFHRIEGARARTHEGSGIGLALVQELARLHGGTVRAESRLGLGTTFTVTMPRGSEHLPREHIVAPDAVEAPGRGATPFVQEALRWLPDAPELADDDARALPPLGGEPQPEATILLVDDNADMRDYVRRLLAPHWTVEAVDDGEKALAAIRMRPPDLVLTDVMMPVMDGFALIRELRREDATRSIPVIMLSARAGDEAKVEGLVAGADDYLVKPFSARELLARVRTHLELGRLRQQLQARHEHLSSLFEQAPAMMCVIRGHELVFEMANDLYVKAIGGRELVGRSLLEAMPELAGQGFDEQLRRVMATGVSESGQEVPVRLAQGSDGAVEETYWTFVYAPLELADGIERVMVIANEVTDRVRARRLLEESEDRFRNLADHAPVMVWVTEADGRCVFLNESWYAFTGQTPETGLGTGWLDVVHPDDRAATERAFLAASARHEPFRIEYRLRRKDGAWRWAIDMAAPRRSARGEPLGFIGSVADVTEQVEARQRIGRLQQATERLATALSPTEIAEIFVDVSEHVVHAAAAAMYLLDDDSGELHLVGSRGMPAEAVEAMRVLPPDGPTPLHAALRRREPLWFESHRALIATYPQLARALTPRDKLQAAAALPLLHGARLVGGVTLSFDAERTFDEAERAWFMSLATQCAIAAERIRLYRREQRARAEAEALVRVAEQTLKFSETFVGILGHDLRNPLAAITTSAELLLRRATDERITRPVERIRSSANRMARMIEQILDFTRARIGGGIPIEPAPVHLEALATQLVEELEGAAAHPIAFEAMGDTHGEWDGDRLAQVISNLLGNAAEHGEPQVPIRLRLAGDDPDEVRMTVWNAGVVPEQILPSLFDPFRRTSGRDGARRSRGLGLGLYIVERVVEAHGGRISVRSTASEGTSFVVSLPRRPRGRSSSVSLA